MENLSWIIPVQKFGIENANGRIYPESVLKQVEIYQQKIRENRVYGQLNHID